MTIRDQQGVELSGATAKAAEHYTQALHAYHCYAGDAIGAVQAAIAESPDFVMAHALAAWMTLVGTNSEAQAMGVAAVQAMSGLPANAREQGHVAALQALVAGEIRQAARIMEDVSIAEPRDSLALHAGQLCDFLLGDSRMLRDRIARALPAWSRDDAEYHAVLGLLAFGLEETGHYERAEVMGREAVALEPRNNWAQHAVAHVLEMQDRRAEGVRWMRQENTQWVPESMLAVHNWWHLALFHLGLGEVDEVLKLFDGPIYGQPSDFGFDMVDAAAMLWRLQLRGADVGDRWRPLADIYEKRPLGQYAFDDAHAMMAFVGAGRNDWAETVLKVQAVVMESPGDNAYFTREVGLPLMLAIRAFGQGDYRSVVERLRPMRNISARFGGSHAQRDLIDLTLIEAATRSGQEALASALIVEREAAKPLVRSRAQRLAA
jgi:tetratricopeptide (TPR) repeat protein